MCMSSDPRMALWARSAKLMPGKILTLKSGAMLPISTVLPSLVWAVIVGSKEGKSFSVFMRGCLLFSDAA
nr:MAG TPA: hypothetical protein [Caudoviricetes sp.]